ncbi:hypothetical protein [Hymenobacter lucidus]|nr:hypothetical protein [Hymenobacter lucidus]
MKKASYREAFFIGGFGLALLEKERHSKLAEESRVLMLQCR